MIRALHVGTALAGLALATVTLLAPPAHAQDQSTEIPVSFSLAGPVPACAVGSSTDLDYGTVIRGGSSEWVYVNERTGAASTSGGIATPSSATVGYARVTASNATSLTVTRAYPTGLGPLTFNGRWAGSSSSTGTYTTLPAASDTRTFTSATYHRHYRFGGTVGGISASTTPGTYDDSINLSITCM